MSLEREIISFIDLSVKYLKESVAENKKLAASLKEKDAVISDQLQKIIQLTDKLSKISPKTSLSSSFCKSSSKTTTPVLLSEDQANDLASRLCSSGFIETSFKDNAAVKLASDGNYLYNTISFLLGSINSNNIDYGSLVKESSVNLKSNQINVNSSKQTDNSNYYDPRSENEAFLRSIGCWME